MWTWNFLFQFKAFELNNDFFCFSGNVAAHSTDRLLFLLHMANRTVFTLSLRVNFNMYPTVYPNCLFQMSVLINETHLGLTTTPIGHSPMLKLKRDWAEVSHDRLPLNHVAMLYCSHFWCVCVWVWSVITTNIFHVQAKSSWIYKTHIDEIYRKLCKYMLPMACLGWLISRFPFS